MNRKIFSILVLLMLCLGAVAQTRIISTFIASGYTPHNFVCARNGSGSSYDVYLGNNYCLKKISPSGTITPIAGTAGTTGYAGDGGSASASGVLFGAIEDVCVYYPGSSTTPEYYICEAPNFTTGTLGRVRKIDVSGNLTTIAGGGTTSVTASTTSLPGTSADLPNPHSICVNAAGDLFIADYSDNTIKKVDRSTGYITLFAGTPTMAGGFGGDGGPAVASGALLQYPWAVRCNSVGDIIISDEGNNRIRKVDHTTGYLSTIGGSGVFSNPLGIAIDAADNIYVTDDNHYLVRKINGTTGAVTTVAGGGSYFGGTSYGDGCIPTSAYIGGPEAVAVGTGTNPVIYIVDANNGRIRKIDDNHVPTFASTAPVSLHVCSGSSVTLTSYLGIIETDLYSSDTWLRPTTGTYTGTFGGFSGSGTATAVNTSTAVLYPPAITYTTAVTYSAVTEVLNIGLSECSSTGSVGTKTISINVDPSPGLFAIGGGGHFCANDPNGVSITLSGSATGINYQLYRGTSTTVSVPQAGTGSGTFAPTSWANLTTGGTYHIVAIDATTGCTSTMTGTVTITVDAIPPRYTMSGGGSYCFGGAGLNIGMSNSTSGINYQINKYVSGSSGAFTAAGPLVASSGGAFNFAPYSGTTFTIAGTYLVVATNPTTGCFDTMTGNKTITILPLPNAGTISGATTVCQGSLITLSSTGTSGALTWTSGSTSIATVNSASGAVRGMSGGTVTITLTASTASCGTAIATYTITVLPLAIAGTVSGTSPICVGTTTTYTDATTAYGTSTTPWSSSNSSIATVDPTSGAVTGVAAGTATITYTATNSCNTVRAIRNVTVLALPATGTIGGPTTVCATTNISLTRTGTSSGTLTWTSSNTSIATVNGSGVVHGVAAGTVTISLTATTASCGTAVATYTITVLPQPVAGTISGTSPICVGDVVTYTDASASGTTLTWSSSNNTIASVNPTSGAVTGRAAGTATITYTVTNSCGTVRATRSITVLALPATGTIGGPTTVCEGVNINLTRTGASSGTLAWSSSDGTIATVNSSGLVHGVSGGTVTISLTATTTSCGTALATYTVTVLPRAVAGTISGTTPMCVGTSATFTDAGAAYGTTHSWTSSNTSRANVTSAGLVTAGSGTGAVTISHIETNSCNTATATFALSVITAPTTPTISGGATAFCAGTTTSIGGSPSGGTWTPTSTAGSAYFASTSSGVLTGASAGTTTITYTVSNICGSASRTRAETTYAQPVVTPVTHVDELCNGGHTGSAGVSASGFGTLGYVWTPGGSGGASRSGLYAGTYVCTVTDGHTCTNTATFVITEPTAITATTSSASVACYGGSTGSATWTASGSTAPYSYTCGGSTNTTGIFAGLSAGTYTCTITDANGCTASGIASITVTEPAALSYTAAPVDISCNDANDGTITFSATGGTPGYTYSCGGTTNTTGIFTGLAAGAYACFVVDANGCTASTTTLTIANPPAVSASLASSHNVTCNAGTDGDFTITGSGGTGTITYTVGASSNTTGVFTGLTAGTYTCTLTDAHGCTTTIMVYITEPVAITVSTSSVAVGCFGGSSGTATWTASGGTAPYSYTCGGATNTTGIFTGLTAGTYSCTITDAHGCSASGVATITITEPYVLAASTSFTDITCHDDNNGVITFSASGGTPGYTYFCGSASNTTGVFSGLSAGTYTCYVVDANGCTTSSTTETITNPAILSASVASLHNVSCNAGTDGNFTISGSGGTGTITYVVGGSSNTTGVFAGLAAGTYTCNLTDAHGCTTSTTVTITEPSAISASPYSTAVTCPGGSDGSATWTASGGTGPYSYDCGGTVNSTGVFTGLTAGTYTCTITDANGCAASGVSAITVSEPAAITFTTTSADIACHGVSNGTVTLSASGGTPGYTYHCGGSTNTTGSFTGLSGGIYSCYIVDANGCTSTTTSATIVDPPALVGTLGVVTNVSCYSGSDGAATFSGSGGTGTITYTLGAASNTTGVFTGLSAGTFTCTLTDANGCTTTVSVTVGVSATTMTWLGGTTGHLTDWNTGSNWSCGGVPTILDNVLIPGTVTYFPDVLTGTTGVAHTMTIDHGANVTITGATLTLAGDLSNNGVTKGPGVLYLNNAAPLISGFGKVNNIELNNSTGGTISTALDDSVTLTGTMTLTSGVFHTHNKLVVEIDSNAGGGRIGQITGGSVYSTDTVIVRQYIRHGFRRYRFWGHPFSHYIPLCQIGRGGVDVTGAGGATNGFTTTGSNQPSAYWYDPTHGNSSLPSDPGWTPYTSALASTSANQFKKYEGIRLFVRGSFGTGLNGYPYDTGSSRFSMWGTINQGNQVVPLTKGTAANQDYNMIGNPFPSNVDVGTVTFNAKAAGNVTGAAYYIWNPFLGAGGQFQAQTFGSSAIPYYMQTNCSYQVRATYNGATMTFRESDKSASATTVLMKMPEDYLSLDIYDEHYHPCDMLFINFNKNATTGDDKDFDAGKPPSPASLNFYSLSSDNLKMNIDTRPFDVGKVIPLGINSTEKSVLIMKVGKLVVPEDGELYLHDKLLATYTLLEQGTEYRFTITGDDNSQGDNRFELSMKPAHSGASNADLALQVGVTPNPTSDYVMVNYKAPSTRETAISVMNIDGQVVYSQQLGASQAGAVKISLSDFASGIYFVELNSGGEKVTRKIVKE